MIDPKKLSKSHARFMSQCRKAFASSGKISRKKSVKRCNLSLTRLDLVSREEFDVQTQVLLRTREKLALLEQRLSELEARDKPEEVKPAPAIPPVDPQE